MTLTLEQQHALDELTAHFPKTQPGMAEMVQTWLGISSADAQAWLANVLAHKDGLQQRWLTRLERNPMDAALEFLGAASLAFYLAEHNTNPKIKTYIDAFYYISTCASVGYADIFAVTQTGRAVAALVMIVGPALAARTLERPLKSL